MYSQTMEYTLRAAVALAGCSRPTTTASLAVTSRVPASYLAKILLALVRAGIAKSQRGMRGGFVLARPAADISVLDVINAVEPLKRIFRCPLDRPDHEDDLCPLHRCLDDAIALVERSFRETSIAQLIESSPCECQKKTSTVNQPSVKESDAMSTAETEMTVAQMVQDHPEWISAMEKLGIDYCCRGQRPFAQACASRNLDPEKTLRELRALEPRDAKPHLDARKLSIPELVDHIVEVHHQYLRNQLPVLSERLGAVVERHGHEQPALSEVETLFRELRKELEEHMQKEEVILFPWAKRLAAPSLNAAMHPPFSIVRPISRMEEDHTFVAQSLERLRSLTSNYTPPEGACATYRALLNGLVELERDLHLHIHEENNILFPWLIEQESRELQEKAEI